MNTHSTTTDLLGGGRVKVSLFTVKERIIEALWLICALFSVLTIIFILLFLGKDSYAGFVQIGVIPFLTGMTWNPVAAIPSYGIAPLIVGTLLVTLGAMIFAVPLSLGAAVYIAEMAPPRVKLVIKPAIELLAGIPSVVYGFFGLMVMTNWLRVLFDQPSGESWLAGSLLLGIMALPTITSVAEDAIRSVPHEYREGSLAVGATRWQTISRVVLPAALSGITAAIILGMGRAIGETMAVMMVTGNSAVIPSPITNVLSPVRTLTGTLGIEMGEVANGSLHYHALFGVAVVLLVITLIVNLGAVLILKRLNAQRPARTFAFQNSLPDPVRSAVKLAPLVIVAAGVALIGGIPGIGLMIGVGVLWLAARHLSPKTAQRIAFLILRLGVLLVLLILGIILFDIVSHGLPAITWEFLTTAPRDLGRAGGIFPAIVGTLYLIAGSILFALPFGVGAAIYLNEYRMEGLLTRLIRTGIDLLNGTPSIVFGLFGFTFLVLYLDLGVSMLAGQLTLGLMILPTIIRTTEEALKNVPPSLREGSLALGATRWQTISRVVLPSAMAGIITGTVLSIGRAAGETAPILFTAVVFSQRFLPGSVLDPVMALPYHLFILSTAVPDSSQNRYGTALVLILLVIGIYSIAIYLRNHFQQTTRY